MCGICGIYNYGTSNRSVDESLLMKMSSTIVHRGPDDSGTFLSPDRRVGFGFRRLSIVDLSPAGHQPMTSQDGNVTIVFNGEIYNHAVLRKEFESEGYRYRSRSDTESILNAYQKYGLSFVNKLLGMFSIALWDEANQQLVLARDRVGIKPLYYSFVNGTLVFGSEIKAILQHPDIHRELDEDALDAYLTFLISAAPSTLFKNIQKLEPGRIMVIRKDSQVKNEEYWNPVPRHQQPSIDLNGTPVSSSPLLNQQNPMTEESCIGTIRTLLRQSIKDRMMSDVPFGVFLSGGIDSSTNVALMAELMDRPVDTFSVGFRDLEQYNEMGYARKIASLFKTNHHEVFIDQKMAMEFLPKLIFHQDEPIADEVCIPLYFVSKLARDNGTIVVQVGEGSDEQFAGYPWYLRELRYQRYFWSPYGLLPRLLRDGLFSLTAPILRKRHRYLELDYLRKATEGDEAFWGGNNFFTNIHKQQLLASAHSRNIHESQRLAQQWHREILDRDPNADYLKRMIYLEFRNRLPELLLMRVDKISMATSIEARVPFLDHRMVEYSMSIPALFKIKNNEPKYILKKAVEGIIPNDIIYRKKQGFAAPVREWLRSEWHGYMRHSILNSNLMKRNIFNQDFIIFLMNEHQAGRLNVGRHLWCLLNLSLWYDCWIEGKEL
ncbi:MAG: asparagine synthase (glutamine-hydrolyzing) [bacterium]